MRYQAVIFDLFGTLIEKLSQKERLGLINRMAETLEVQAEEFLKLWFATFNERDLGVYETIQENINVILNRSGLARPAEKVEAATRMEIDFMREHIKLFPQALETISRLKREGYKLGLISGCSPEVPEIFQSLPIAPYFDVKVFSCAIKVSKPDPLIYESALKQLGVKAGDCLYVGDGDGQELTGALQVGMHPVLIRDPNEDANNVYRVNSEAATWQGPVITRLDEVFTVLESGK